MKLYSLPVGLIATNCYLLEGENHAAVVVDPGAQADKILAFAREQGLNIRWILFTHGHFDHVCAANEIKEQTGAAVYIGRQDAPMLNAPMTESGLKAPGYNDERIIPDVLVQEGDKLELAGMSLLVLDTPGHTAGGVTYVCGDTMFSGDTLFAGSIGRTDLAGGDFQMLKESLKKLAAQPGDYKVYPGHGSATTLEQERRTNPYLGEYYDSFD